MLVSALNNLICRLKFQSIYISFKLGFIINVVPVLRLSLNGGSIQILGQLLAFTILMAVLGGDSYALRCNWFKVAKL